MVSVNGGDTPYGEQDTKPWWLGPNSRSQAGNQKGVTFKKSRDYSKDSSNKDLSGAPKSFGDFTNFLTDIGRNSLNFVGNANAWLQGRDPVVGGNEGDMVFGRAWTDAEKGFTPGGVTGSAPGATADTMERRAGTTGTSPSTIDQLLAGFSDPFAALRATTSQRGAENDARLQAMYQQVADYIRGTQGDTKAIYDTAAQGYQSGNQAATNAVNAGYGTARDQLNNALATLGIQDAANTILARGEDMSGNQAATTSALAQRLGINLDRNTAAQTAALSDLINRANATIGQGAQARNAYQQSIASQLAQLEGQSTAARNSYLQSVASSQADAEAAAAKADASAKTPINADQWMTEYNNAYKKFKEQNYTDEAARSAADTYMKAWYGNKAIS